VAWGLGLGAWGLVLVHRRLKTPALCFERILVLRDADKHTKIAGQHLGPWRKRPWFETNEQKRVVYYKLYRLLRRCPVQPRRLGKRAWDHYMDMMACSPHLCALASDSFFELIAPDTCAHTSLQQGTATLARRPPLTTGMHFAGDGSAYLEGEVLAHLLLVEDGDDALQQHSSFQNHSPRRRPRISRHICAPTACNPASTTRGCGLGRPCYTACNPASTAARGCAPGTKPFYAWLGHLRAIPVAPLKIFD
jgi:hypothetical protein